MPGVPRIQHPSGEEARPCTRVSSSRRPPVPLAMASGPIMGAHSMAQDPLSHVASWLTTASADGTEKPPPTSAAVDDPILALIAEEKRLAALWIAAHAKGAENPPAKTLDEAKGG